MERQTVKTPWAASTGNMPMHLTYFEGTMFEAVQAAAAKHPHAVALDFMGKRTTYQDLITHITTCAKALKTLGIRENDTLTIALPNCPQAIFMLYAANEIGAIANMVHPLSSEQEIAFYINTAASAAVITLDQFYPKIARIREDTKLTHVILTSIADVLPPHTKIGYRLTAGRKQEKVPENAPVIPWKAFWGLHKHCTCQHSVPRNGNDPAVILYTGGTTGTTKGAVLTNRNFNALGQQIIAANPMFCPGDKMLSAMPIFHGFGLGVCIHTMLTQGGCCVLVPRFTPKSYVRDLVKKRCNFIAGVPTLYEAMLQLPHMKSKDLSCLKGVFCGGDSLSGELKRRLNQFLQQHNASVSVREGYGTTETVTACCLMPSHMDKDGSVGLPFPDTYIKIVTPDTDRTLPYGEEGEILLSGPTVMREYLHNEEETAKTLRTHADGLTWVYTGDLGIMDKDGFVYFKGRAKRMIVTAGYNVYPAQLENILDSHALVQMSCVIGIPDPCKMQKIKAFVKLIPAAKPDEDTKQQLWAHCHKHIAKYAMPYAIEFREDLPKTPVGKVAYRVLEEEEIKKQSPGNTP